jgi:hypothetical protein
MNETPPEHIDKVDWRIKNITWTTAPSQILQQGPVEAGASVRVALIRYGKEQLAAAIPNAPVYSLPTFHRDPFDRLIIAQANRGGFHLVTHNPEIARYQVAVLW